MSKKNLLILPLLLTLFQILFVSEIKAQINNPRSIDERFVVQALQKLQSAQDYYRIRTGNRYGSFAELQQLNLIDSALASGEKYGYNWILQTISSTPTSPARFYVTATPNHYPKTGRKSFFIDESLEIRGADKGGKVATFNDPVIDDCTMFGNYSNEICTIIELRNLHRAERIYQTTTGAGHFAILPVLYVSGLISRKMASSQNHGYTFSCTTFNAGPNIPANFKCVAVPINYGITDFRSFYIDVNGLVRGADRNGAAANEFDPPVND